MKGNCLQLNLSDAWTLQDGVAVIGYAFSNEECLSAHTLANYFNGICSMVDFTECLQKLNGIFSVIISHDNFTAAAIDTTRLYPVFYTCVGDTWKITDNPYSLLTPQSTISSAGLQQMRSSFATLSGRTLIDGIYQIKPGTAVEFLSSCIANTHTYFHYNINACETKSVDKSALLSTIVAAVKRLIKRADGRQIVVPISAGYDSRIILCLLKEQGYENVLTYTMGSNAKDSEVSVASRVAQILGYPHYQIDLNLVCEDLDFSDFDDYVMHLGALTNFSWCEEYASVKWLKKNQLLDDNAVFAPGHAGDFFAGSHLSKSLICEDSSVSSLVFGILFNNFEANRGLKISSIKREFKTLVSAGSYPPSLYNAFILNNRLTHFISNSARTFTFFGYEVLFPLWDMEFLQIMRRLPMNQLHHSTLYNECVEDVFVRNNVNFTKPKLSVSAYRKQYIKNVISVFLPAFVLSKLRKTTIDVLGSWHVANILCKDFSRFACKAPKPFSINSALTEWYIGTVIKQLNKK